MWAFLQDNPKGVLIGALFFLVFVLFVSWRQSEAELKKARLVYQHPQVKTIEKIVTVTGPVKIVTKTIEMPSRKEVITEEYRGTVVETTSSEDASQPVPLSIALAPPRTDRWLLSLGVNRLSWELDGKMVLAGYSWGNRFDLQAGFVRKDETSPWVLGTVRF